MQTTRTRQRRWQDHKHLTRSLIAGACLGLLVATGAMAAAPDAFPTKTTTVKVDRVPITGSNLENHREVFDGESTTFATRKRAFYTFPSNQGSQDKDQQLQNTVVYDKGIYYLWYRGGASVSLLDLSLATLDEPLGRSSPARLSPQDCGSNAALPAGAHRRSWLSHRAASG